MPQADRRTRRNNSRIAGHGLHAAESIDMDSAVLRFDAPPLSVTELGDVNHSCDPNLGWSDECTLVTTRHVDAGEELTLDYATCVVDPDLILWCHCETYRCRQVIEGSDWAIPQLQLRYAGQWHPAVQRRIAR